MPGTTPKPCLIYHFTHVTNLDAILSAGTLACKRDAKVVTDVSNGEIQQGRSARRVPNPPGGTIHDYVPFYFGRRSPMLLRLASHHRTQYRGRQDEFVYIVSSVENIVRANLPFVFTDGHSTVAITAFYTGIKDLDKVDWNTVNAIKWNDIPGQDNDRKRRKQAEFMLKDAFPLHLTLGLVVKNETMRVRVAEIVRRYPKYQAIQVVVRDTWYYEQYA